MQCSNCNFENRSGISFCENCGTRLSEQKIVNPVKFCTECGHGLREGIRFCESCGAEIGEVVRVAPSNIHPSNQPVSQPSNIPKTKDVRQKNRLGATFGVLAIGCLCVFVGISLLSQDNNSSSKSSYASSQDDNPSNPTYEPPQSDYSAEKNSSSMPSQTENIDNNTEIIDGVRVVEFANCPQADLFLSPEGGPSDQPYKLCLSGFLPQEIVHVNIANWFPPLYGDPHTILEFDVPMSSGMSGAVAVTFTPAEHNFYTGLYLITAQGLTTNKITSLESVFGVDFTASTANFDVDVERGRSIINNYWIETFPVFFPDQIYTEPTFIRSEPPYSCPGREQSKKNNATSCGFSPVIIWDDVWMKKNYRQFGSGYSFYMLAHEWGHQIQTQSGLWANLVGKEIELGADCFAGSAFAYAEDQYGEFANDDWLVVSYAMRYIGDPEYVDWGVAKKDLNGDGIPDMPHGTMHERFGSFLNGLRYGADYCIYNYDKIN